MWQPEPGWQPLQSGASPTTVGVWRARMDGRDVVVKRLAAPAPYDPPELLSPRSFAWWRRPAEVAADDALRRTPGLRAPATVALDEDDEGITIVSGWVPDVGAGALFHARALGRFAAAPLGDRPWLAMGQLRDRLASTERRGGWPTLARTTMADLVDHLWRRRTHHLDALDELPSVLQHGDPVPGNLPGRDGDDCVAVDWATLGWGPLGADLGYLCLSAREDFEPLLAAYVEGYLAERDPSADPDGAAVLDAARLGAQVTAVYTALGRAEWALARVASGEGALAGKYRHPGVAPHLLTVQRLHAQVEALL